MDGIPEQQSIALKLRFGDGSGQILSYRQVAGLMGITHQGVAKLIRKGIARLRANGHDPADLREPANS